MELRERQLIALMILINKNICKPVGEMGHILCQNCYITDKCIGISNSRDIAIEAIKDFTKAEVLTVLLKYGDVL